MNTLLESICYVLGVIAGGFFAWLVCNLAMLRWERWWCERQARLERERATERVICDAWHGYTESHRWSE